MGSENGLRGRGIESPGGGGTGGGGAPIALSLIKTERGRRIERCNSGGSAYL